MDRRLSPRKNMHLGVTLEIPSCKQAMDATLRNISLGGAFIETLTLLPPNALILIELTIPGNLLQNSFRLNARTVRNTPTGIGLVFVGAFAGVIKVLEQVLFQYEQQPNLFQ
jgi:hypothetical protein